MNENLFFSIIINNYNYAQYIEACIESVFAQTYKNYELIVVDDGSTDHSCAIIDRYADQLIAIRKENGGQGSAYNVGFAQASGDLVLFLDADDLLLPHALEVISNAWVQGAAKLHYKLEIIDENGQRSGVSFPDFLDEGDVRSSLAKFGSYASPPASGNVYSRQALDNILPMESDDWRIAADSYTIFLSPYSGNVIAVPDTLGLYRIDYSKKTDLASQLVFNNSPSTPWDSYSRAVFTARKICHIACNKYGADAFSKLESPPVLKLRAISFRIFRKKHVINDDGFLKIIFSLIQSLSNWSPYSFKMKVQVFLWFIMLMLSPRCISVFLAKLTIKK